MHVQLLIDVRGYLINKKPTTCSLKVVPPDGKGCNNPLGLIPCLLYEGDDCYDELKELACNLWNQSKSLEEEGVILEDGTQVKIVVLLGGELKQLNGERVVRAAQQNNLVCGASSSSTKKMVAVRELQGTCCMLQNVPMLSLKDFLKLDTRTRAAVSSSTIMDNMV